MDIEEGDPVRVSSRRGSVIAPAHIDSALRPGLVFMTLHFQDVVKVNQLTIDVSDPVSGTAEFKACAVQVEPIRVAPSKAGQRAELVHGDD
jgi:formate dehydrogenase major subunit